MVQPFAALPECVVVLSPQYAEATDVFSSFFVDGLCVWPFTGYLFGISRKKASAIFCDAAFSLMRLGRIVVFVCNYLKLFKVIFS